MRTVNTFEQLILQRKATAILFDDKYEITCVNGHVFLKTKYQVQNGEWCPECFKNVFQNEEKCKFILEELTGKSYKKTRKVLSNSLELDMYNEELKVALEFQGIQHYEFHPFFHRTNESLEKRLKMDDIKRQECKQKGITLIEVSYLLKYDDEKTEFILNELNANQIPIIKTEVDWGLFYQNYIPLERLKYYANEHNGLCLATYYIDNLTPVTWECEHGHRWDASPNSIQSGSWCPKCGVESSREKRKASLEDIKKLAQARNGKYLSVDYLNANEMMEWECENNHIFSLSVSSVQQGRWCTICTGTSNHTIEVLQEKAASQNGTCLSETYHGNREKHLFQCTEGHVWLTTPLKVLSGSWCHICGGNKRISLERIQEYAQFFNGKCLTDSYKNNTTKMMFVCEHGHEFQKSLVDVKKAKRWCPICKINTTGIPDNWFDANFQTPNEKKNVIQEYEELINAKSPNKKKKAEIAIKREIFLSQVKVVLERYNEKSYSVELLKEIASLRNGEFMSNMYSNARDHHEWICENNHTFTATPSNVLKGKWCPWCAKSRVDIKEMQNVASSKGGKLLSTEYVNARTKYKWQCEKGHIWEAVWNSVSNGTWCPECNGTSGKVSLEDAILVAKKQEGECLSTSYSTVNTKMEWKCKMGHTFLGTYNNIRRGKWCPYCSGRKKWKD